MQRLNQENIEVDRGTDALIDIPPAADPSQTISAIEKPLRSDSLEVWDSKQSLRPLAREVVINAQRNGHCTTQGQKAKEYNDPAAKHMLRRVARVCCKLRNGERVGLHKFEKCSPKEFELCAAAINAVGALASELGGVKPCVSLVLAMLSARSDVEGLTDPKLYVAAKLLNSQLFRSKRTGADWSARLWTGKTLDYARFLRPRKNPESQEQFSFVGDLQTTFIHQPEEIINTEQVVSETLERTGRDYGRVKLSAGLRLLSLAGIIDRQISESREGRYLGTWALRSESYRKKNSALNARTALLQVLSTSPTPMSSLSTSRHRTGSLGVHQRVLDQIAPEMEKVGLVAITCGGNKSSRMINLAPEALEVISRWRAIEVGQLMDPEVYTPIRETLLLGKHLKEVSTN